MDNDEMSSLFDNRELLGKVLADYHRQESAEVEQVRAKYGSKRRRADRNAEEDLDKILEVVERRFLAKYQGVEFYGVIRENLEHLPFCTVLGETNVQGKPVVSLWGPTSLVDSGSDTTMEVRSAYPRESFLVRLPVLSKTHPFWTRRTPPREGHMVVNENSIHLVVDRNGGAVGALPLYHNGEAHCSLGYVNNRDSYDWVLSIGEPPLKYSYNYVIYVNDQELVTTLLKGLARVGQDFTRDTDPLRKYVKEHCRE